MQFCISVLISLSDFNLYCCFAYTNISNRIVNGKYITRPYFYNSFENFVTPVIVRIVF